MPSTPSDASSLIARLAATDPRVVAFADLPPRKELSRLLPQLRSQAPDGFDLVLGLADDGDSMCFHAILAEVEARRGALEVDRILKAEGISVEVRGVVALVFTTEGEPHEVAVISVIPRLATPLFNDVLLLLSTTLVVAAASWTLLNP